MIGSRTGKLTTMNTQTSTVSTMPTPSQPVIVKKIVKVKRKRSILTFLSATIFFLSLFIIIGAILSLSVWLHTYHVFTQEKLVAEVHISKKVMRDGKPTFHVKYIPKDDVSGFWGMLGSDAKSDEIEVEFDMVGDQVFFNADFIRWKDWLTMVKFKPVYKVNRIVPGYQKAEDYKKFGVEVFDLNGGPDNFAAKLQDKPEKYRWLAKSVFFSGAGINVQDQDVVYELKVTEDALVIQRK